MTSRSQISFIALLASGVLSACSGAPGEDIGRVSQALSTNICGQTVPAGQSVDGIPAYSDCPTSTGAYIYSDNGVDTSTTMTGPNWIVTQWGGGYQCTELANRYLYFRWNVSWQPQGNAGTFCDSEPPAGSGVVRTMTPVHGDLIVIAPGVCYSDAVTGHVAVVDTVSGSTLSIVEQNQADRSFSDVSCAKCFLHVVANSGAVDGGVANGGGGGGADASGRGPSGGAMDAATGGPVASGEAGATSPPGSGTPPESSPVAQADAGVAAPLDDGGAEAASSNSDSFAGGATTGTGCAIGGIAGHRSGGSWPAAATLLGLGLALVARRGRRRS